tara:strand:+ start:124 stop:468 length:345 start_codon:yes stop_codon:yes gene_type:complete
MDLVAIDKRITTATEIAQQLILELHASDPTNVTFEQVGLLDGQQTVLDLIKYGERGCALHHLLYMIHESDIRYPRETMLEIHEIAKSINEKNHYSKENQVNLTEEHLKNIFNAP